MSKNTGTSELINYFDLGVNGDVGIAGSLDINTIANATTDTDTFLVSDTGIIKYRTGAQLLSDIGAAPAVAGGYVPYTGATTNVDLGVYNLTTSAIIANGSGSNSGIVHLESNAIHSLVNGYGSIASGTTNQFNLYQTTGAGVFRGAIFSLNSITEFATRTFTLPDADGTIALTSNIPANPVGGTGTSGQIAYFSGTSTITSESGLTWDATNNNLSIGGVTANSNLTVSGSDNTNIFTVLSGLNSRLHVGTVTSPNNDVYIRSQNNYNLKLGTNNTNYLTIFNSGNVFIGTSETDNGARLQVSGAATISSSLTASGLIARGQTLNNSNSVRFLRADGPEMAYIGWTNENANNSTWYFKSSNGNPIGFSADGTNQQVTITTSGNVGIGTSSPTGRLTIQRPSVGASTDIDYLNEIGGGPRAKIRFGGTDEELSFWTGSTAAERMRITSGGNVLIGTTTDSGAKFRVFGTGVSANIYSDNNTYCLGLGYQGTLHGYLGGISSALYGLSANGGQVLLNSSSVWVPVSDVKRKRNFENYDLGLNAILGLKPKYYHMDFQKDSEQKQVGLVAQEVKEFIPQAFEQNDNFIGLNYNAIIVTMVKAIQEQQQQIQELKNKLS